MKRGPSPGDQQTRMDRGVRYCQSARHGMDYRSKV